MTSLPALVAKFNPGLTQAGVSNMLSFYDGETFEADVAPTRPQCPRRHLRRKRLYETRHGRLYHAEHGRRSVFCFRNQSCAYSFSRL